MHLQTEIQTDISIEEPSDRPTSYNRPKLKGRKEGTKGELNDSTKLNQMITLACTLCALCLDVILFKVALDPCYNYVCIYFKSMHEMRRLKPTKIEIFMRIYFLKFFV